MLGQSVLWKVEVQVPVYWKEQLGNHSSSDAVVLFCHRLTSVISSSFHWPVFASTTFGGPVNVAIKCHIYPIEKFPRNKSSACSTNTSARSPNVFASAGFPIATEDVVGLLFGLHEKLWQVVAVLFYDSHLSFCSLYSDLNVSELDFGNRSLNLTVAFTSLSSSNVYNCDCPSSSMLKRDSRMSGAATLLQYCEEIEWIHQVVWIPWSVPVSSRYCLYPHDIALDWNVPLSLDSGQCGFTMEDSITVPDIEHLPCLCRYVCSEIERKGPSRKGGLGNADFFRQFHILSFQ